MRKLELINPIAEPSARSVESLQHEIGAPLPSDYSLFLASHGGAIAGASNRFIDARKYGLESSVFVDRFLTAYEIVAVRQQFGRRIPSSLIPIADNPFGDFVCLDIGSLAGAIAFWDHEKEDAAYDLVAQLPPPNQTPTTHVADTFNQFLEMLGPIPET